MKCKGVLRKVDKLGRVTLVKEDRIALGIKENDKLEVIRINDGFILKKVRENCMICDCKISKNNAVKIDGKPICKQCIEKIVEKEKNYSGK